MERKDTSLLAHSMQDWRAAAEKQFKDFFLRNLYPYPRSQQVQQGRVQSVGLLSRSRRVSIARLVRRLYDKASNESHPNGRKRGGLPCFRRPAHHLVIFSAFHLRTRMTRCAITMERDTGARTSVRLIRSPLGRLGRSLLRQGDFGFATCVGHAKERTRPEVVLNHLPEKAGVLARYMKAFVTAVWHLIAGRLCSRMLPFSWPTGL